MQQSFTLIKWGIQWCFAHNGDVPIEATDVIAPDNNLAVYNPIGDTDSERIFCAILNALRVCTYS